MVSLAEHDVCTWFRQLSSYRRLEMLCQMLNLCVPLELRFVETYVSKLASRELIFLKDHEHRANSHTDLKRLVDQGGGPLDGPTRSRLVISLALLKSDNTSAAEILYPALTGRLPQDKSSLALLDPKCLEELILLYSMAALHCAFTFSQQTALERLKSELVKLMQPKSVSPTSGLNSASTSSTGTTTAAGAAAATAASPTAGATAAAIPVAPQPAVGMACPPGQPVYTYPLSMVGSLLPPQFQWCGPLAQNVQLPTIFQSANSIHPTMTFATNPSVPTVPHPKLNQVTVKSGQGSKVTLCGNFTDGRQIHVVRDYGQIAELRNRLNGPNNSLPSLSMMYNNNTDVVHKEIKDFFTEVCANFADLDLVSNFFDQQTQMHPQPQTTLIATSTIPRFTSAPPPPFTVTRDHQATSDQEAIAVREALKSANAHKHMLKFKDVTTMNDFCELTEESLKARGLSSTAIDRIQQVQALRGASIAASPTAVAHAPLVAMAIQTPQQQQQQQQPSALSASGQWHSSEEDTTPPSSSPSPPNHQQFTSPPPQFYSIMMPMVQPGGATTYVPTTYSGYPVPTFVATAPPQQNGTYVTTQGVSANGQHLVHPMLVHTQHNPQVGGHSGGISPLGNASGPMNHLHAHNGQSGAAVVGTSAALSHLHHPPPSTGSKSPHSPTSQGGGQQPHTKIESHAPSVQNHMKRQPLRSQH
ncbi:uncharacterized protein LOC108864452 [Galendromus occidentalis]|uniref:Uncharacterized protein LOC108864452 n=1 Tax=Galendromus occidentalis TaxID=34638 RepID=A0AAJ7L4L9_9ACAR|nr:uncharacterized protein LOC108864452 [Galendromus occidentalis]